MDPPFDADNFTAILFGTQLKDIVKIEATCRALMMLPIDFEFKKYALLQYLDRIGVKLERWMVELLRSG